jgi:shikimate kinase
MNLSLIGYRGAGKTTIARLLALELGWEWVDADVEIELRGGKSIAAIFADDGEGAFRDLESQVLAELASRDGLVIACGGGVVLREENRAALKRGGKVVWLKASAETILARVAADASTAGRRPQLTTAGGAQEVIDLLARRTPLYRECADLIVETDDRQPAEISAEIVAWMRLSAEFGMRSAE